MNVGPGVVEPLVDRAPDGGWEVRSPRVGIYRAGPKQGARRAAGESVGRLSVLNHEEDVILPAGVEGVVTRVSAKGRAVAVQYGEHLFSLAPDGESATPPHAGGLIVAESLEAGGGGSVPVGCFAVSCPIDGVFYHRPSPGAAPFVRPGDTVETGRTIGLIEAMKSFNAVVYGAAGLPPRARVVEFRAGDAAEVRQGSPLVILKPE